MGFLDIYFYVNFGSQIYFLLKHILNTHEFKILKIFIQYFNLSEKIIKNHCLDFINILKECQV